MNNNQVRYSDPSGYYIFENDPEDTWYVQNYSSNTDTNLLFSFDTKTVAEKIPVTPTKLRIIAMGLENFALAVDTFTETILLGYVGMGIFGGTIFESNPVSGNPSYEGAGWINGEFNPFVQRLVTLGNTSASAASLLAQGAAIANDHGLVPTFTFRSTLL